MKFELSPDIVTNEAELRRDLDLHDLERRGACRVDGMVDATKMKKHLQFLASYFFFAPF